MITRTNTSIPLRDVTVTDSFFSRYQELVCSTVIPYQEKIMDDRIEGVESHAFQNVRIAAGEAEGEFRGMVFQDSDIAKWLEAVGYALALRPDPALEARADEIIALLGRAQQPDGYLNSYFICHPQYEKFSNLREAHEMYCAGHLIEAGVAYYQATGKDTLLSIVRKSADLIYRLFIEEGHEGYPGHQEIELALMKLYRLTGEDKYARLAKHFIDARGRQPHYFDAESERLTWSVWGKAHGNHSYTQAHIPPVQQREAVGHAVRAVYMYTAMADIAAETGDEKLMEACDALWEGITGRKMYLTGGIGSAAHDEAFTVPYDLPNDTVYAETCASIGLMLFAKKMQEIRPHGKYADVIERALYNTVLGGISLDGTRFFYCNPLDVDPAVSGVLHDHRHVLPERPAWYPCACCPPNVARTLASLGNYAWSEGEGIIYSHLFMGGTANFAQKGVKIALETNYPWDDTLTYTFPEADGNFTFAVRIPDWAEDADIRINGEPQTDPNWKDGYYQLRRDWKSGDKLTVRLEMPVRKIYANDRVLQNIGKVALMRGPLVYCAEQADNGDITNIVLPRGARARAEGYDGGLLQGVVTLNVSAVRLNTGKELYSEEPPGEVKTELRLIPYYAWANRGKGQMRVWFSERS